MIKKHMHFRLEVLLPLLILLGVLIHDWKNQSSFWVMVDGVSMLPTYQNNEKLLATTLYPRIVKDDVVVAAVNDEIVIKRVIYIPGDKFWAANFDNSSWTPIPNYTVPELKKINMWTLKHIVVPENKFWVEGDNRAISLDSRKYGFIERTDIRGLVCDWRGSKVVYDDIPEDLPGPLKRFFKMCKEGRFITKEKKEHNATSTNF